MKITEIQLPDFSDHPPPPQLTFEQFQHWVCVEIPAAVEDVTPEVLRAEFMKNEGSLQRPVIDLG